MVIRRKKAELIKAVSELQETDYSKEPELNSIYRRLSKGRKQFGEILEKNFKAVMQISSLDLTMQHQTEKNVEITRDVARQKAGSWFSVGETRIGQGREAAKAYLHDNPEIAQQLELEIRKNFDKLLSNQARAAAKAAGRAVDVSADDFDDAD